MTKGYGVRVEYIQREKKKSLAAIASEVAAGGSVQAVIQSMPGGLIVSDGNQRVVFCNVKAAELLGKKAPIFGLPVSEYSSVTAELKSAE